MNTSVIHWPNHFLKLYIDFRKCPFLFHSIFHFQLLFKFIFLLVSPQKVHNISSTRQHIAYFTFLFFVLGNIGSIRYIYDILQECSISLIAYIWLNRINKKIDQSIHKNSMSPKIEQQDSCYLLSCSAYCGYMVGPVKLNWSKVCLFRINIQLPEPHKVYTVIFLSLAQYLQ